MKLARVLGAVAAAAMMSISASSVSAETRSADTSAGLGTYADYSRITERSAGQFVSSGGATTHQWSWRTEEPGHYSISWNPDKPEDREDFFRSSDGKWLLLNGWSGNGTYYTQRVTSERQGDVNCTNMRPIEPDGGRQHYVRWNIPAEGYCLEATGTITEKSSGKTFKFRHRQVWYPPAPCSNAHYQGQTCIRQHEIWWDNNQHPWKKTLERDQYLAKGLGMAFKIRQTYPEPWSADLRRTWTY